MCTDQKAAVSFVLQRSAGIFETQGAVVPGSALLISRCRLQCGMCQQGEELEAEYHAASSKRDGEQRTAPTSGKRVCGGATAGTPRVYSAPWELMSLWTL